MIKPEYEHILDEAFGIVITGNKDRSGVTLELALEVIRIAELRKIRRVKESNEE